MIVALAAVIVSIITDSFVLAVIRKAMISVCFTLWIMPKLFRGQISDSMKKARIISTVVMLVYFGVLDTVRYAVSEGVYTILFLPLWVPLLFMIIMYYTAKDSRDYKTAYLKTAFFIGIVLTVISLILEIATFVR